MKFLIDEDVPVKLLKALSAEGHDAARVAASAKDKQIAEQSVQQDRILITLDKDFADRFLYSPSIYTIIYMRIHPPFADALIAGNLKGLMCFNKTATCAFRNDQCEIIFGGMAERFNANDLKTA